jgi:hypothetical protein
LNSEHLHTFFIYRGLFGDEGIKNQSTI